jgi:hypothetical protein
MRFMMLLKADRTTEAGTLPTREDLEAMGRYNETLVKAGVLLDGAGLQPSSKGKRIRFPERTVVDGPFPETKELIAGFWMIKVKSMDEAVAWMKRCPWLSCRATTGHPRSSCGRCSRSPTSGRAGQCREWTPPSAPRAG